MEYHVTGKVAFRSAEYPGQQSDSTDKTHRYTPVYVTFDQQKNTTQDQQRRRCFPDHAPYLPPEQRTQIVHTGHLIESQAGGFKLCAGGTTGPLSLCAEREKAGATKPVAVDPVAEQQKLDNLRQRRIGLAELAERDAARCEMLYSR